MNIRFYQYLSFLLLPISGCFRWEFTRGNAHAQAVVAKKRCRVFNANGDGNSQKLTPTLSSHTKNLRMLKLSKWIGQYMIHMHTIRKVLGLTRVRETTHFSEMAMKWQPMTTDYV